MQQQRGQLMKPCLVYFGCRDSSEELYSEQMQRWLDNGVITQLHVATSRGKGPKVFACSNMCLLVACLRMSTKTHVSCLVGSNWEKVAEYVTPMYPVP